MKIMAAPNSLFDQNDDADSVGIPLNEGIEEESHNVENATKN